MDTPSTSANSGSQGRQKRVLPSRSGRGGPGVGSCDVDIMILDTQRRKFENEPLIPVETKFLLTTNPAVVADSTVSELGVNVHANDRYFERPEVLKAYREQEIIQTPEFVNTTEVPTVTGRFRVRNSEDGTVDTSDAAYEKRHRKYETFEKRQRLREKEKLKHEQYKLKERIEQLRAMDIGAFLALPASSFSHVPSRIAEYSDDGDADPSGANINNSAAHSEGEWRRKEMLDVAFMLEERYRVLLPPDRARKTPGQSNMGTTTELNASGRVNGDHLEHHDSESEEELFLKAAQKESEKLKLKIKFPRRPATAQTSISTASSTSSKKRRKGIPLPPKHPLMARRIKANYQPPLPETNPPSAFDVVDHALLPPAATIDIPTQPAPSPELVADVPLQSITPPTTSISSPPVSPQPVPPVESLVSASPGLISPVLAPMPTTPMSNPDIAVLETGSPDETPLQEEAHSSAPTEVLEPIYVTHPHKRVKISPVLPLTSSPPATRERSVPPIESISAPPTRRAISRPTSIHSSKQHVSYAGAAGRAERTNSVLMVAAIRSSGNSARKAKRHLSAFGSKLRNEVFDDTRDFVLPSWVYLPEEYNKDGIDPVTGPVLPSELLRDT